MNILDNPFVEGPPSIEKVKEINEWLSKHSNKYAMNYVKFYHGTSASLKDEILTNGLKPTSYNRRRSFQSTPGYVYLANTPQRAKMFGDLGNMSNSVVFEVYIPINKLSPDLDQLNNKRSVSDEKIKNTVAYSIVYGGGIRVKGKIEPYQIKEYKLNENMKNNNLVFWHGGNLDGSLSNDFEIKTKNQEYGPGLYLTSSWSVVKNYIKGSRKLYKVEVKRGRDIKDINIPYSIYEDFIDTYLSKPKATFLKVRTKKYKENNSINLDVVNNIFVNTDFLTPKLSKYVRQFYIENGGDYHIVNNAFGWGEDMLVLFNYKKIASVNKVKSNEIEDFDFKNKFESILLEELTAYHGTPHDFDSFSTDKIGTGEGHQSFGWGLYFTDKKEIAQEYAEGLGTNKVVNKVNILLIKIANELRKYETGTYGVYNSPIGYKLKERYDKLMDYKLKTINDKKNNYSKIYTVKIHQGKTPDQYIWLDWYEHPNQNILNKIKSKRNFLLTKMLPYSYKEKNLDLYQYMKSNFTKHINDIFNINNTNKSIYKELERILGSPKEASLFLLKCGIDGIRYPSGTLSGIKNSDAYNYVVFDPRAVEIQNKEKLEEGLLSESNHKVLYHFTDKKNILGILSNNKINLSSTIMNQPDARNARKINFLSLTRNGNPKAGFPRNNGGYNNNIVRIQFDGDKLTSRYKIVPLDYWQMRGQKPYSTNLADIYHRQISDDEAEERLFSNDLFINNINTYIKRIDILDANAGNVALEILKQGKALNIPVYIYTNIDDFRKGRDINDTLTYNKDDERTISSSIYKLSYSRLLLNVFSVIFTEYNLDFDTTISKVKDFLIKNDIDVTEYRYEDAHSFAYKVYEAAKTLTYGRIAVTDAIRSIEADLTNLVRNEHDEVGYKVYKLLVDELIKNKCKTIEQYLDLKFYNKLPTPTQINYAQKLKIYKLDWDETPTPIDITERLDSVYKNDTLTRNSYSERYYGEKFGQIIQKMYDNGKTFGDLINYICNNYKPNEWDELFNQFRFGGYYRLKILN